MEGGGTHEGSGSVEVESSSEADSLTKASKEQQTVWILVLFQQCCVPVAVLAQLFGVGTSMIQSIARGTDRNETVAKIKTQFDQQFKQTQRLSLDERLRMFLSGTSPVLSRKVLTEVRQECQKQFEAAKDKTKKGNAFQKILKLKATFTVMDDVLRKSSMTSALNNAGSPVAQATGDTPLEDHQTSASDWVFVL